MLKIIKERTPAMEWEKSMQENVFTWQSPDGSRVTAFRINQEYCKQFNDMETLKDYLADCEKFYKGKEFMGYYGVGNHGGGPTIKNIQIQKGETHNERKKSRLSYSY
jgi:alpha-mannosidase